MKPYIVGRHRISALVLFCLVAVVAVAQARPATGRLQVSATVVSSSQLLERPDGTFSLIVSNAPSQADARDLLHAMERIGDNQKAFAINVTQDVTTPLQLASHAHRPHK